MWWREAIAGARRGRRTLEQRQREYARVVFIERDTMLPVKAVVSLMATLYLVSTVRSGSIEELEPNELVALAKFWLPRMVLYAAGNAIFLFALSIAGRERIHLGFVRFCAFCLSLLDGVFLGAVVFLTGGAESIAYLGFYALAIRNAYLFSSFPGQILANFALLGCYTVTLLLHEDDSSFFFGELFRLRSGMMLVVGSCFWGVSNLSLRQRGKRIDLSEFTLRSEKLAAAGRIAADVAHELKNPLAVINNAAYLLGQERDRLTDEMLAQVATIRDQVERSDRTLTDLLRFASFTGGRVEQVDVNDTLRAAVREVLGAEDAPGGPHRVNMKLDADLPPLYITRHQLQECFVSLLRNAVDSMPAGGVIDVRTSFRLPRDIEVSIADQGEGIPPEKRQRVFDSFFTTKPGAAGLGLAIAQYLAETFGGRIEVSDNVPRGTVFTLNLPIRMSAHETAI